MIRINIEHSNGYVRMKLSIDATLNVNAAVLPLLILIHHPILSLSPSFCLTHRSRMRTNFDKLYVRAR